MPVKERKLKHHLKRDPVFYKNPKFPSEVLFPSTTGTWYGRQFTVSEGHRRNRKTGKYEEGGPFYTIRADYDIGMSHQLVNSKPFNSAGTYISYDGIWLTPLPSLDITDTGFFGIRSKDTSDLDPLGATAISVCAPTNPNANLAVAMAELKREGLPNLPGIRTWKRRTEVYRSLADEFLNAQFGWLPFIGDIKDTANSVRHSRDILKQHHKGQGSTTRRKFEFPSEHSSSTVKVQQGWPVVPGGDIYGIFNTPEDELMTLTTTEETVVRRWFEGAFTYAAPSSTDSWRKLLGYGSDADKLFGITITPDVLWNLTPWSWAIDWFSNTGDVINNVTNFVNQGLVMRYGYMMEESTTTITSAFSGGKLLVKAPPPSKAIMSSKVRRPANPFGFGLTWEGLSTTQALIAAALGISRS